LSTKTPLKNKKNIYSILTARACLKEKIIKKEIKSESMHTEGAGDAGDGGGDEDGARRERA